MRKIERDMIQAIKAGKAFTRDNTSVTVGDGFAKVHLHGHHIANVWNGGQEVQINLRGYNTRTTRSRLTAIVREFVPGALGVATKQGQVSIVARRAGNMVRINIDSDGWFAVNALLEARNAR